MDDRELDKRLHAMYAIFREQIESICRVVQQRSDIVIDAQALELLEILLGHGARLARELQHFVNARGPARGN
jgi:hypothetical protein